MLTVFLSDLDLRGFLGFFVPPTLGATDMVSALIWLTLSSCMIELGAVDMVTKGAVDMVAMGAVDMVAKGAVDMVAKGAVDMVTRGFSMVRVLMPDNKSLMSDGPFISALILPSVSGLFVAGLRALRSG